MKTAITLITRNQGKFIGSMVLLARQQADEVIVLDDNSADNTVTIAELAGAAVQTRSSGSAVHQAVDEARRRDADILVAVDAASGVRLEQIPGILAGISGGADVLIGIPDIRQDTARMDREGERVITGPISYPVNRVIVSAYSKKGLDYLAGEGRTPDPASFTISDDMVKQLKVVEMALAGSEGRETAARPVSGRRPGGLKKLLMEITEHRPLMYFGILGVLFILFGIIAGVRVVNEIFFASGNLATGSTIFSLLFSTIGFFTVITGVILNILSRRGKRAP
ncbi:MAG: glycosyltransferase family 2 protein [Dehalococcoidales bacterium]|nr:glycosyltransferase family 2 protein [Dehalococcoidales bacterium]